MTEISDRAVELELRLRSWTIDWNGAPMVDGEPPRDGVHVKELRDAADIISELRQLLSLHHEGCPAANCPLKKAPK